MSQGLFPSRRVLWMPLDYPWRPHSARVRHCCSEMNTALRHVCDQHSDPFSCPDTPVVFHEVFGEYGLPIRDGGASYLIISNCPWCGAELGEGARDAWFDRLESDGLSDTPFASLPEALRTSVWRQPERN